MTPNGGPGKCRRCVWGVLLMVALAILVASGLLGCAGVARIEIPGVLLVETGSAAQPALQPPPVAPVASSVVDRVDHVPDPSSE